MLTAAGGALLSLILTVGSAVTEGLVFGFLSWIFAAGFLLACSYVAARICRADLLAAVIIPPLSFAVAAFAFSLIDAEPTAGGWIVSHAYSVVKTLARQAPLLMGGTALAGAIILARYFRAKRIEAESAPPSAPAQPSRHRRRRAR